MSINPVSNTSNQLTSSLSSNIQDIITRENNLIYTQFTQYLAAHPNATGSELGSILSDLRQKSCDNINKSLSALGWPQDGQQAYTAVNQYADSIQAKISYYTPTAPQGKTEISSIPAPQGGVSPMQKIIDEYTKEKALYQKLNDQYLALSSLYQSLSDAYKNAGNPADFADRMNAISQEMTSTQTLMSKISSENTNLENLYAQAQKTSDASQLSSILNSMQTAPFTQDIAAASTSISNLSSQINQLKTDLPDPARDIANDKVIVESSISDIDAKIKALQQLVQNAKVDYELANKTYLDAKAKVDAYANDPSADPSALSQAQADLTNAKNALEAVAKILANINDPEGVVMTSITNLQTQLDVANNALKVFVPGVTLSQANDAAKSASGAKTVASQENTNALTTLNPLLQSLQTQKNTVISSSAAAISDTSPTNSDGSSNLLTIDGVTVIQKTINGTVMYFPIGRSSQGGGDYSPNEAVGYYMRSFVNAGDKDSFQKMLNGLLYLMNQSNIVRVQNGGQAQPMYDWQNETGLTGWNINIANILSGKSPYDAQHSDCLNTATDADEDIIAALIEAYNKWGDMTASDPLSKSGDKGIIASSMSLKDMANLSVKSFLAADFQSNGVLSLGDFQSGKGIPYSDYFDPTIFVEMMNFVGPNTDNGKALKAHAVATWNYISASAQSHGGWITDSMDNTGGVGNFGAEASRSLLRMGQYLLFCQQNGGSDPLGILNTSNGVLGVKDTLKTLVYNLFKEGVFKPATIGLDGNATSSIGFQNTHTPYGGMLSGPLAVALCGLSALGELPSNVTSDDVANVIKALNFDIKNSLHAETYSPSNYSRDQGYGNDWQQGGMDGCRGYFATCLAILGQQIIGSVSKQQQLINQIGAIYQKEASSLADLQSQLNSLNQKMNTLQSDFNQASAEYQTQVKSQIDALNAKIVTIQTQMSEENKKLSSDLSLMQSVQKENDLTILSQKLSTITQNSASLQTLVTTTKSLISEAVAQSQSIDQTLLSDPMIVNKKTAQTNYDTMKALVDQKLSEVASAQSSYASASQAYADALAQVSAYQLDPTKKSLANQALADAKSNLDQAASLLSTLTADTKSMQDKLSTALSTLNSLLAAKTNADVTALLPTLSTNLSLVQNQITQGSTDISLVSTKSSNVLSKVSDALSLISSQDQKKYQDLANAVYQRVLEQDAQRVTPVGQTTSFTQIGDNFTNQYVHSESTGYKMLVDISNGDKAAFLEGVKFMASYLDNFGLMNWNIDPVTGKVVAGYQGHYAATDADQDILYAMMQGLKKWPELANTVIPTTKIGFDPTGAGKELPLESDSTTLIELIKSQLSAIWTREVGHSTTLGTDNLLLNGDGWGRDAQGNYDPNQGLDVSYFRPSYCQTYQNFFDTYMKTDSKYSSQNQTWYSTDAKATCVYNNMYQYIINCMKNNSMCLPPDSSIPTPGSKQYQPGGMLMGGGYDAIRVMMFIAMDYKSNPNSPQAANAKAILQTIVGYFTQQTTSGSAFNIPSPSAGMAMTVSNAPSYAKVLFGGAPVVPSANLMYRDDKGNLVFNPGNPTAAACIMIAANALGSQYKPLENTCYDYLMKNLPSNVGGGGGTDGGVVNIPYFGGMLAAIASEYLSGKFPATSATFTSAPVTVSSLMDPSTSTKQMV